VTAVLWVSGMADADPKPLCKSFAAMGQTSMDFEPVVAAMRRTTLSLEFAGCKVKTRVSDDDGYVRQG